MRRLSTLSAAVVAATLPTLASASDWYHEPKATIESSSRLNGSDRLTTQMNSFGLKSEYNGDAFTFVFDGHLQYDAVYDIHDGYSDTAENEYRSRHWLDEAYISGYWNGMDISLGYQKVVWGQADDMRVVDVINPLDLKDFVLFDIDEYRLSTPMLRVETTLSSWDVEGLWIFESKGNQLPAQGSEFDLGLPDNIPTKTPDNAEFGLKASNFWLNTDIDLYVFHGNNDMPVLSFVGPTSQELTFDYHEDTMLGASFSRPVGSWVIRQELALFQDRSYAQADFSRAESDTLQWLLGFDYLMGDWLFTGQISDSQILDWDSNYTTKEHQPFYTLSSDVTMLSGKLALRVAASHADYSGGGQLYQTKLSYQHSDHWQLQFNTDILDGNSSNFFGQFADKDRIWFALNYTF